MEITRMLVVEWINPVDLLFLDSAYCNNSRRESWLKVLRLATHVADYGVSDPDLFELYQNWVFAREVPTKRLCIGRNVDSDQLDLYLQKLGGFVQEIIFQKLTEGDFGVFAELIEKHCDNIVILTCSSCELEATMMTMMNYKSALRHLRTFDCTDIELDYNDLASWEGSHHMQLLSLWLDCADSVGFVESVLKLVDPCVLQQLCIKIDEAVHQDLLLVFFPLCCNLLSLSFSGSNYLGDEYFASVVQFCPNLLHLDVSSCEYVTDEIADELVEGLTQLRTLNISGTILSNVFINALAAHNSHSLQALHASNCAHIYEGFNIFGNSSALITLECSCQDILNTDAMNNLTTLLISDDFPNHLAEAFEWVILHGERLENLRVISNERDIIDLNFTELNVESLPRLHTLSICVFSKDDKYKFDLEEPESLDELRVARPNLRVCYNTDELLYDMMKLPLHCDP